MTTSIIAGSLACLAFASVAAVSTARQAGQSNHLSEADGLKTLKLLLEQQASPLCIQRKDDRKNGFCDLSEIMRVSEPALQATTIDSVSLQLSDYTFRLTRFGRQTTLPSKSYAFHGMRPRVVHGRAENHLRWQDAGLLNGFRAKFQPVAVQPDVITTSASRRQA